MEDRKPPLCRVCIVEVKEEAMSLFDEYKNLPIYRQINFIANVNIQQHDGLPTKICSQCLAELETSVSFKRKCENNNTILQASRLGQLPPNSVPITEQLIIDLKKEPEDDDFISEDDKNFGKNVCQDSKNFILEVQVEDNKNFFHTPHSSMHDESSHPRKYSDSSDDDEKPPKSLKIKREGESKTKEKLQCADCNTFFKSKGELRIHCKNVHMRQTLICESCKRDFKSLKAYNNHHENRSMGCIEATNFLIEGIGKNRTIGCKECNFKSKDMPTMIRHRVTHTGERRHTCDLCGKTFAVLSCLLRHRECVHNEHNKEITCHLCGKLFRGRSNFSQHLATHSERQVQCQVCSKMYKNKGVLKIHMLRHNEIKMVQCELCPKRFHTKAERSRHRKCLHLGMAVKKRHECTQCGFKSVNKKAIMNHKPRHEQGDVCCLQCGRFFESTQKLLMHQQNHLAERKHSCPHCDRKFRKRFKLTNHIRDVHLQVKEEGLEIDLPRLPRKPRKMLKKKSSLSSDELDPV